MSKKKNIRNKIRTGYKQHTAPPPEEEEEEKMDDHPPYVDPPYPFHFIFNDDGDPPPPPLPEQGVSTIPKRVMVCLSEFLYFTVYRQVHTAIRSVLAQKLDIQLPINYASDVLSPLMARSGVKKPIIARAALKDRQMAPLYLNPTIRRPTCESEENFIVNAVRMKRDIEREAILRKGLSKTVSAFVKTIVKRDFFNHANRPTNLEWKAKQAKMTETSLLESGERRTVIKTVFINYNMHYMEKIYQNCFPNLVKMQSLDRIHIYVYEITQKLNTLASIVNACSKGEVSPLSSAFHCFRRIKGLEKFDDFKTHLLRRKFGDLNQENILEIDLADVFGNKGDVLFNYLNPDGRFNYTDPRNALLINDVAQDILPFMVSELVLLKLLLLIGSIYPDEVGTMIDRRFSRAYDEQGGCFTVLQCFPGFFTLLCYWANRFRKHKLGFVQTLEGINNGKHLVRENYITHMKGMHEITTIALELIDIEKRFPFERLLVKDQSWRRDYCRFDINQYADYFKNQTFLVSNSFIS